MSGLGEVFDDGWVVLLLQCFDDIFCRYVLALLYFVVVASTLFTLYTPDLSEPLFSSRFF